MQPFYPMSLLECIPNFSEGRDQKKIQAIVAAITGVHGIFLLGVESDVAHHRTVVTFAGEPKPVLAAAFEAVKKAAELINLDEHRGEHPRMGATDVLPLVPIQGLTDEECVAYARTLGEKIGSELQIPVYLYEKAATRKTRENLADVRKGEYEGIAAEIGKNPDRDPDFGPTKLGPAGGIAIGVREPLIAFNVNLDTKNLNIAKQIAKKVRFSSGGLPFVKALGFELKDRGQVQVSMNLTNYKKTPVYMAFEAVKKEAEERGVTIGESELIGLIPEDAIIETTKHYLHIHRFKKTQILEHILMQKRTKK